MKKALWNLDTAMEYNTGQMVPIMKETGFSIKQKVKELSGMPKEMYIVESSKTIWQMDMENTHILTAVNIKVNLEMMFKKGMVKKNGLMELNMLVATKME